MLTRGELARNVAFQPLERVAVDRQRQLGDPAPELVHRDCSSWPPPASSRLDQLVESQLLEPAADGVELGGAELDELAALADQVERLAQLGVSGVEPRDDLLEPCGSRLVASLGSAHGSILARSAASLNEILT